MIQNISARQQFDVARLQMISEENIKANRLKREIIDKINQLCETRISKKTRTDKISDIRKHIELHSEVFINLKEPI